MNPPSLTLHCSSSSFSPLRHVTLPFGCLELAHLMCMGKASKFVLHGECGFSAPPLLTLHTDGVGLLAQPCSMEVVVCVLDPRAHRPEFKH
eukprot:3608492-Amphidinium_carterae.1